MSVGEPSIADTDLGYPPGLACIDLHTVKHVQKKKNRDQRYRVMFRKMEMEGHFCSGTIMCPESSNFAFSDSNFKKDMAIFSAELMVNNYILSTFLLKLDEF